MATSYAHIWPENKFWCGWIFRSRPDRPRGPCTVRSGFFYWIQQPSSAVNPPTLYLHRHVIGSSIVPTYVCTLAKTWNSSLNTCINRIRHVLLHVGLRFLYIKLKVCLFGFQLTVRTQPLYIVIILFVRVTTCFGPHRPSSGHKYII
jgi:hypothetical protein